MEKRDISENPEENQEQGLSRTEIELVRKRKIKQRLGMVFICAAVLAVSVGSIGLYLKTRNKYDKSSNMGNGGGFPQIQGRYDGMVSASGTTSIGINAIDFEIDFLEDTRLYVEKVYLSNGDTVHAGDKYVKFTDDSIKNALEELESTALSAGLSYRSGIISNNQSKLQAKYAYDMVLLEAQYAEQIYNDTLAQLQADLDSAEKSLKEAQSDYDDFYSAIVNGTLYKDYKVDELKKAYESAHDLYINRVEYWEVTESELNSTSSSAPAYTEEASADTGDKTSGGDDGKPKKPGNGGPGGRKGANDEEAAAKADRNWIIKAAQLLKEEDQEAEEEYEQVLKDYQNEIDGAELKLKTLANKLEAAKENYTLSLINYQKNSLSAKTTYETAVAKGQTAKNDYDTQITSLQETLSRLKDAKEEADENLTVFKELAGDGYLYTKETGTVLMVRAEEGKALLGGDIIFAYSNPDEISVSVSVSQDDIAKLYVGEPAEVMISDYGNFLGRIKTINPVSSSNSRTSVSYTVIVSLEGDVSGLGSNLAATVTFTA